MKIKIEFENLDDVEITNVDGLHCEGITQSMTYTSENRHACDRTYWCYGCSWFLAILPPGANVEYDFKTSGKSMLFDRLEKGRDVALVRMPRNDEDIDVAMPCSKDNANAHQTCAKRKDGSLVLCIGKEHHATEFI